MRRREEAAVWMLAIVNTLFELPFSVGRREGGREGGREAGMDGSKVRNNITHIPREVITTSPPSLPPSPPTFLPPPPLFSFASFALLPAPQKTRGPPW